MNSRLAILILVLMSAPATVFGQWVEYDDETATLLQLDSVGLNDTEEKDIAVGDLNGDGIDDVVIVRKAPFSNPGARTDVLLINEGGILVERTATFAPEFLSIPTDARDVLIADVTGDGWNDVIIANTFHQQPQIYRNLGIGLGGNWEGLVNESATRFPFLAPPGQDPGPGPLFCGLAAGDVDRDQDLDLFFANYNPGGSATEDVLLINDGAGNFTNETAERLGTYARVAFGTGAAILDLNRDGHQDIVKISTLFSVTPWNSRGIFTLFNDGTGHFDTLPFQRIPGTTQEYMFMLGRFNADPYFDMYIVQDPQDQVAMGTGINPDGTVIWDLSTLTGSPRTGSFGGNLGLADVDQDGDLDMGVAPVDVDIQNCSGGNAGEFALLENDGNGNFSDPWGLDQNIHVRPHDFSFLDVDGDGCYDILMALCTGYAVFRGTSCAPVAVEASADRWSDAMAIRAHPNPSRGATTFSIRAGGNPEGELTIEIVDVRGARVRSIWSGSAAEAPSTLSWDGRDSEGRAAAAGMYFVRMQGEGGVVEEKVLLVR